MLSIQDTVSKEFMDIKPHARDSRETILELMEVKSFDPKE